MHSIDKKIAMIKETSGMDQIYAGVRIFHAPHTLFPIIHDRSIKKKQ